MNPILLVANVLQPVDRFAVELFFDGEVRDGRRRGGVVPMFFAGREPDEVAGMDFFDGAVPTLVY